MDRAFGEIIPISVGTAALLEKILADHSIYDDINFIYFNIRTLVRNFIGSFTNPITAFTTEIKNALLVELDIIDNVLLHKTEHKLNVTYYQCSYNSLAKCFPDAKLKTKFTEKQNKAIALENLLLEYIKKNRKLQLYDVHIVGYSKKALIVTHLPVDLISYRTFKKLVLIESHTGAVKEFPEWVKKLTKNEDYYILPFNVLTLQLIGDRSNQFDNMGKTLIQAYHDLCIKNKWHVLTTLEKIKFDIRRYENREIANTLLQLSKITLK